MPANSKLTRIGVFYDGNYFSAVNNYYQYSHERKTRISIRGLHEFIRNKVAECEGSDGKYCQIVDAHYFRGRPRALEADKRGLLLKERLFDDVLVREGVVAHYLPMGPEGEKGIDVWLALEAFELAIYKQFDVCVLVACDGDFLPLVRKLNGLGIRVMLLAWDFEFVDQNGDKQQTKTAQVLRNEVTYPVMMHQLIDDRSRQNDPLMHGLFLPPQKEGAASQSATVGSGSSPMNAEPDSPIDNEPTYTGTIVNLLNGFGFIKPAASGENIFFYHSGLLHVDFNDLKVGDKVRYKHGQNQKGLCAVEIQKL
jgi:cold shock CspA family protein